MCKQYSSTSFFEFLVTSVSLVDLQATLNYVEQINTVNPLKQAGSLEIAGLLRKPRVTWQF